MAKDPKDFSSTLPSASNYPTESPAGKSFSYSPQLLGSIGEQTPTASDSISKRTPPLSDRNDSGKNFQVALAIYAGAFLAGLSLIGGNDEFSHGWWYGIIYVLSGGFGLVSITPWLRSKLAIMRSPLSLWAAAIITWVLLALNLGFTVYDHLGNRQSRNSVPPTVQTVPSEPGKRVIVNVAPDYLMSLYDNKLSDQGDRLFAPFIGKWIHISGSIMNISTVAQPSALLNMPVMANTASAVVLTPHQMKSITLLFDKSWGERLSILARDQNIAALCQIKSADDSDLQLEHCELEDK